MLRTLAAALLITATLAPATSLASRPRVVVDREPTDTAADGLPAVSADGRTVALAEGDSDPSGAAWLSVRFLRVRDGAVVLDVPITATDENGKARRVSTEHGRTPWARARFVNAELTRGGYRPLRALQRTEDERRWVGGGLRARYDARNGRLVVLGARGALATRLPRQRVSCGMELERPDEVVVRPAEVLAVHADPATGVALLTYGLRYASCMCSDDVSHQLVRLSR